MHFFPILSTLRRHRTAALLIILEIAFTCAIVCNTIFVIRERLARMDRESGVAETELLRIQVAGIGKTENARAITGQDLAALRAIPGVKAAAMVNMVPFGKSSWNSDISTKPDDPNGLNAATYLGSPKLVDTLGVRLIAGRDFTPDEYVHYEDVDAGKAELSTVIVSSGLGRHLFHDENPLGKQVYVWGKKPSTIVGVFERLARPNEYQGAEGAEDTVILGIDGTITLGGNYLVRVDPDRKLDILDQLEPTLTKVTPNRITLNKQTFGELRETFFKQDHAMAILLIGVSIALLIITALGVVGLASFWVQQRTRQIGIRRALGATKRDIVNYFQLENFILATAGIVLGMGLAYAINLWLMDKYELPRLPFEVLPVGAAVLWLLGQVAVLGPALRAAMIPPAIATRSV